VGVLLVRIVPFLLLCPLAWSQQLPFRTFTSRDGLPRTEVRTLCQDSLGYIWCGTYDGFSRYDGASFVTFEVPGGLGANAINAMMPGTKGELWVGTNGGGLSLCVNGGIRRYPVNAADPISQENRVNAVCRISGGRSLVGTDRGAFLFDGERFERFRPEVIPASWPVEFFFNNGSGTIWIGTSTGMYVVRDTAGLPCRRIDLPGMPHVNAIAGEGTGLLWCATDAGIRCLKPGDRPESNPGIVPPRGPIDRLARTRARALLVDRRGTLWVGTDEDGLFRYSTGVFTEYTSFNGLPANRVSALMEDSESNIWVATNAGLCRLGTRRIVNYMLTGRLANSYVGAIAQDKAGNFWFGTPYGLTSLTGDRFTNFTTANGLHSSYILSLLVDQAGAVWIGTGRGLNRFSGRRILRDPWNPAGARLTTVVRSLYQDGEGIIWAGWERGFSAFSGGRVADFRLPDTLYNTLVVALSRGPGGSLWVGTQGEGLYRYAVVLEPSGGITARLIAMYGRKDGLADLNIRSLLADSQGTLWVGTRYGGAYRLHFSGDSLNRVEPFGPGEGLTGDWVTQMIQDRDGYLWFATNRGVDRLRLTGELHAVRIEAIHGMAGDDAAALYEDRDGEIWIGASNGVTRYSPGEEQALRVPPPVYLQRFQVLGLDDSLSLARGAADLSYTQHAVSFEYIGLSYSDESAVQYRYMLEGMDGDWSAPTLRRYVTYAQLPPGNYTFRVAARGGETGWSPHPASFSFRIAAPFWASPLFIGAVLLCAIAAAFGVHRSRVRRIVAMARVRNRIAADLHDDIGSTLSSIAVFSGLAEQELGDGAPEVASIIRRIGANSRGVMESLDDIVWMVRPGNDSLDVIMSRIREYATAMFEARGIRFTLSMPPALNDMTMSLEDRRQLYLIMKEAVNNIVKHSSCSSARLDITVRRKELVVTIQDDGKGFDSTIPPTGDGITNMRERASAMGGHLTIESGTDGGTTINLRTRIT
jgi:ligand-binding sensor domain-containing protein/signal transduction histidine kinase